MKTLIVHDQGKRNVNKWYTQHSWSCRRLCAKAQACGTQNGKRMRKRQCDGIIQHANSNCANKNALKAGIVRAEAKRSKNPQKILGTSVWGRFGQNCHPWVFSCRCCSQGPARTCEKPARNLREPARTCENLREPARTCENLREPARTCENLRGICKKLPKCLDSSKMSKTGNFASNSYWVGVSSTFVLIWSFAHHRSKIPKNERFEGRQHLGKFCTGLWSASQWLSFNVYNLHDRLVWRHCWLWIWLCGGLAKKGDHTQCAWCCSRQLVFI